MIHNLLLCFPALVVTTSPSIPEPGSFVCSSCSLAGVVKMRPPKSLHKERCRSYTFQLSSTYKSRPADLGRRLRHALRKIIFSSSLLRDRAHAKQRPVLVFSNLMRLDFTALERQAEAPHAVLCAIRAHLNSMPLSYIQACFSVDVMLHYIRLWRKTKDERKPVVLVTELACERLHTDPRRSCSSFSSKEHRRRNRTLEVHFSCSSFLSTSAAREAFDLDSVRVIHTIRTFKSVRLSLVLAHVQSSKDGAAKERIPKVVKQVRIPKVVSSSMRRSKSGQSLLKMSRNERPTEICQVKSVIRDGHCDSTSCKGFVAGPNSGLSHAHKTRSSSSSLDIVSADSDPSSCHQDPAATTMLIRSLLDIGREGIPELEACRQWLIDSNDLEVGDRISSGSSGTVYKGVYRGHVKVAVKRLQGFKRGDARSEGVFRREVLGLSSCCHPNVLKFLGVCVDPRLGICIVTKYMERGSLLHHLQRKQKLENREVHRFAKDIAEGMQYLHSLGIIHMDLKTPNILLGEDGTAVVGDLGVARFSNEHGESSQAIGTYRWMAPEVFGDEAGNSLVTTKSDVYSFGILLWELVTCKVPYADYSPVQAAAGVVMHGLRPPIPQDCFPPFRCLIRKCWSQNPSDRPHFSQIVQMLRIISKHVWSL